MLNEKQNKELDDIIQVAEDRGFITPLDRISGIIDDSFCHWRIGEIDYQGFSFLEIVDKNYEDLIEIGEEAVLFARCRPTLLDWLGYRDLAKMAAQVDIEEEEVIPIASELIFFILEHKKTMIDADCGELFQKVEKAMDEILNKYGEYVIWRGFQL